MTQVPTLLIVSGNKRNLQLLVEYLGKEGYQCLTAASLEEFDDRLHDSQQISLALVDISGFERSIWQRCERLHTLNIPLLVISPKHSLALQQESISHGARGILVKPLIIKELMALVHNLVESES